MTFDLRKAPFLYLLTMPITSDKRGRLGGVIFAHADAFLHPLEEPQFIWCRLPERILPDPGYLFVQGINPALLRRGLNERDFIQKIQNLIKDRTVITWNAKRLSTLSKCAKRSFKNGLNNFFLLDVLGLTDLCSALHAAHLLGSLSQAPHKALDMTAQLYNCQKQNKRSPQRRLCELQDITLMLRSSHQALFDYQLRSTEFKNSLLNKALNEQSLLSCITADGMIYLTKIISQDPLNHEYLCLQIGRKKQRKAKYINALDGNVIAPAGVLTKERCDRLQLDFVALKNALDISCSAKQIEANQINEQTDYFDPTNEYDLKFLKIADETPNIPEPFKECSVKLMEHYFFYLGDNERGKLSYGQYKKYETISKKQVEKQLPKYMQKTQALINHADEDSQDDALLINAIANYPLTI